MWTRGPVSKEAVGSQQGQPVVVLQLKQVRKTFQNTVKFVGRLAERTFWNQEPEPEPGTNLTLMLREPGSGYFLEMCEFTFCAKLKQKVVRTSSSSSSIYSPAAPRAGQLTPGHVTPTVTESEEQQAQQIHGEGWEKTDKKKRAHHDHRTSPWNIENITAGEGCMGGVEGSGVRRTCRRCGSAAGSRHQG